MSSSDSKGRTTLRRPGYEQCVLGFVGLCVVGMYSTAALSPVKRAMYPLPLAPAALVADEAAGVNDQSRPAPVFAVVLPPETPFETVAMVAKASPEPMTPTETPLVSEITEVSPEMSEERPIAVPPARADAVSESISETVKVAVAVPPKPGRKPDYEPSSAPLVLASGDDSWQPERRPLSAASPPGGGTITNLRGGMTVKSVAKLGSFFDSLDYSLTKVRHGHQPVPRVFLNRLPRDLKTMSSVSARKALFLKSMLPLILQANDTVMADRGRLLEINSQVRMGGTLSKQDRAWLKNLAGRYGLDKARLDRTVLVKLLDRVDVVPPSLALSQAVEESGWGTSRFAQDGNAPFGQWTFNEARGLIPLDRDADSTHAVQVYSRLIDGVHAYIDNLNTHRAYREFRKNRATMRRLGTSLDGFGLARTLARYSERGHDYVDTLHTIMSTNDLAPLDRASLHGAQIAGLGLSGG
jgi:Bax protein